MITLTTKHHHLASLHPLSPELFVSLAVVLRVPNPDHFTDLDKMILTCKL
jgi:hypothetical protein